MKRVNQEQSCSYIQNIYKRQLGLNNNINNLIKNKQNIWTDNFTQKI